MADATEGAQLVSAEWGFDRRTIQSPPVVVDGTVFIGARNGFLYALDAQSGAPRWRVDHEISWINGMPAVADGVLYTGTSDGRFFQAVDVATGEERWRKPTALGEERLSVRLPTRILASPVLSSGMLLVGGLDGAVYAVRLDATQPLRRAVFHDTAYARAARFAGGSQLTEFLTAAGLALHGASHRSGAVGPAAPFRGRSCAGIVEETFPSQKPSPDVTVRVYVACLLCVALTLPGLPAHAQTRPPVQLEIFETTMPEAAPSAPWTGRVLTALGGAALGAGIGFFASQVVRGDWEDGSGLDRPVWAAVGGSIGFAVGFSFPIAGRGTRPDPSRGLPSGRFVIRADELRGTGVKTAAEAVELLRPEWLRGRGTHILGERADETIQVYLDDVHLGGLRFLGDVPATTVRAIHFFDAAAATLRWGAGHSHGVILIVAEGGMPSRGGS